MIECVRTVTRWFIFVENSFFFSHCLFFHFSAALTFPYRYEKVDCCASSVVTVLYCQFNYAAFIRLYLVMRLNQTKHMQRSAIAWPCLTSTRSHLRLQILSMHFFAHWNDAVLVSFWKFLYFRLKDVSRYIGIPWCNEERATYRDFWGSWRAAEADRACCSSGGQPRSIQASESLMRTVIIKIITTTIEVYVCWLS